MNISAGFEPSVEEDMNFFISTETISVNFNVVKFPSEKFFEKLDFYLPFHKDFLLSLNKQSFENESEIKFPSRSNEQELMVAKNIKEFVSHGNKNKLKQYMQLKTRGRDKYSSMRLAKLKEKMSPITIKRVEKLDIEDKHQDVTYRWILRGLPVEMAIHKVKVDLEVSENVANNRRTHG